MSDIIKHIKANKKMAIGLLVLVLITFGWVKFIGISPKSGPSIYAISTADSVISILDKMSEDEYLKIAIDKLSIFQSNQELEFKKSNKLFNKKYKISSWE